MTRVSMARVTRLDQPQVVTGRYAFDYEPASARGLTTLRERYGLDDVVAGARNEWGQILRLRDWVSSQWDHGWDNIDRWERTGLAYLRRAERGECFTCAVFAFLMTEVLTAMGFIARSLTLAKRHVDVTPPGVDNIGHCVTEVWSNQLRKWTVLDPDTAAHFEYRNIPLSALEVHTHWLNGTPRDVDFVQSDAVPPLASSRYPGDASCAREARRAFLQHRTMDFYHHLEYQMWNRHYTRPRREPVRLLWCDRKSPPLLAQRCKPIDSRVHMPTGCESDIEYTLNQTEIYLDDTTRRRNTVNVTLRTNTPWLDGFEAKIDKGPWRKRNERFPWTLRRGKNRLTVRSVNRFDRRGIPSSVTVDYSSPTRRR